MERICYTNDDLELDVGNEVLKVDVSAEADYEYTPGTMYNSYGDPGDPPECYFEITDVEATFYRYNEQTDEEEEIEKPTKEMWTALNFYLEKTEWDC